MPRGENKKMKRRLTGAYLSSVISISLVLLLIGVASALILNAGRVSNYFKENIQISLLCAPAVGESEAAACAALDPAKDVDCITEGSLYGVFANRPVGFAPCTAEAVIELLDFYGYDLTGAKVTVVGRSLVIGKPVSQLLLRENATVTVCHTRTKDLAAETRRADIIIAAAGVRNAITISHVCPGQTIIDVGINTDENGKMVGDAAYAEIEPFVGAITPVPGGVGSVTTALLFAHVVDAAEKLTGAE